MTVTDEEFRRVVRIGDERATAQTGVKKPIRDGVVTELSPRKMR
jgi:hypothetical protein